MLRIVLLCTCFILSDPASAQQLYKCSDGKGGNSYQQTPCASDKATKAVVQYKRTADAPHAYGKKYESGTYETTYQQAPPQQQYGAPAADPGSRMANGYVKCTSPSGGTYIASGQCKTRSRTVPVDPQPGMVRNVRNGQERFMVPAGSNGFIDPNTGQYHNRIGPPPTATVRTQDSGQAVSRADVCEQAKAAAKDYNRTMDSIREAERRIAAACGR